MDARLILAAVFALMLSGCATTPPLGNLCSAGPIILDKGAAARLTRAEKEQIVTLNKSGAKICGWEAAK